MTIQQQFFTAIRVRYGSGQIVHFPPQTKRSGNVGRGNDRRRVRVKSNMGRFSLSAGRLGGKGGSGDAASTSLPLLHADSAGRLRPGSALHNGSFPSLLCASRAPETVSGHADSGLVTISDYLCLDSERPHAGVAKMRFVPSMASGAGNRVAEIDVQGMIALKCGRMAGCDAGKGALELTAGSLAEAFAPVGRRHRMSAAQRKGNERNRVKC